jgi:hypothetical protein
MLLSKERWTVFNDQPISPSVCQLRGATAILPVNIYDHKNCTIRIIDFKKNT